MDSCSTRLKTWHHAQKDDEGQQFMAKQAEIVHCDEAVAYGRSKICSGIFIRGDAAGFGYKHFGECLFHIDHQNHIMATSLITKGLWLRQLTELVSRVLLRMQKYLYFYFTDFDGYCSSDKPFGVRF